MTPQIDAVLLDLGNVVFSIDFAKCLEHWAQLSGRSFDELAVDLLADPAYVDHERGLLSTSEYFEHLRSALSIDLDDQQMLDGWNAIYGDPIDSTVSAMVALTSSGFPLHAFSNTNAAHHAEWEVLYAATMSYFDSVHLSHEIGHRKPDAEAFEAVAASIGVEMDRILFFDDTLENIEGATALDINAVLVDSTETVRNTVRAYGLAAGQGSGGL